MRLVRSTARRELKVRTLTALRWAVVASAARRARGWRRACSRVVWAASRRLREGVEGEEGLEIPVDWVGEEEALGRYLNRGFGNSYDFGQV